jgi:5-(aminomethyl)-3-furanmethanol phosphate kinase
MMLPTAIWKVGGSLFELPDLGTRLVRLVTTSGPGRVMLMPGGGETADLVRRWQPRFGFSDETAHELAVETLRLNAWLLMAIVPNTVIVPDFAAAEEVWRDGWTPILAANQYLAMEQSHDAETSLPPVWEVTSDSIAAWIALRAKLTELVLLKSVECPTGRTCSQATAAGLVDGYFSGLVGHLPQVRWCDLRADEPRIKHWLIRGQPVMQT